MPRFSPLDILMAVSVPLVWGMGLVFAKGAIAHFPPILLMAFRFLLTALVLVWFTRVPRGNLGRLFTIAIVAAAIQYSLTFTGLLGMQAGIASLIIQLEVPLLVLLGALILGERPGAMKWAGIAVAFCGMFLMVWQGGFGADIASVGLVVAGTFVSAVGQVMVRRLRDIEGLQVTAWVAVFAAPQLFVMSAIFEDGQLQAIREADAVVWGAVVYMGLVMTALGYFMWNTLLRRHEVGRVAPFILLLPLYAVLGGMVFLGEEPQIEKLLGGLVIVLGVAIITIRPRRAPTPAV